MHFDKHFLVWLFFEADPNQCRENLIILCCCTFSLHIYFFFLFYSFNHFFSKLPELPPNVRICLCHGPSKSLSFFLFYFLSKRHSSSSLAYAQVNCPQLHSQFPDGKICSYPNQNISSIVYGSTTQTCCSLPDPNFDGKAFKLFLAIQSDEASPSWGTSVIL